MEICIHTISRPEENGSTWWNSFQFGFGSKRAYQLYLVEMYKRNSRTPFPRFDFNLNGGIFLYGDQSVWIKQNHNYRYEAFYLLRFHIAHFGKWGTFLDMDHHAWLDKWNHSEHKVSLTANLLLSGKHNLAALYYQYFPYDSFSKDNQDSLGALGFKIVF